MNSLREIRDLLARRINEVRVIRRYAGDADLPLEFISFEGNSIDVWGSIIDNAHQRRVGGVATLVNTILADFDRGTELYQRLNALLRQYQIEKKTKLDGILPSSQSTDQRNRIPSSPLYWAKSCDRIKEMDTLRHTWAAQAENKINLAFILGSSVDNPWWLVERFLNSEVYLEEKILFPPLTLEEYGSPFLEKQGRPWLNLDVTNDQDILKEKLKSYFIKGRSSNSPLPIEVNLEWLLRGEGMDNLNSVHIINLLCRINLTPKNHQKFDQSFVEVIENFIRFFIGEGQSMPLQKTVYIFFCIEYPVLSRLQRVLTGNPQKRFPAMLKELHDRIEGLYHQCNIFPLGPVETDVIITFLQDEMNMGEKFSREELIQTFKLHKSQMTFDEIHKSFNVYHKSHA